MYHVQYMHIVAGDVMFLSCLSVHECSTACTWKHVNMICWKVLEHVFRLCTKLTALIHFVMRDEHIRFCDPKAKVQGYGPGQIK